MFLHLRYRRKYQNKSLSQSSGVAVFIDKGGMLPYLDGHSVDRYIL